MTYKRTVYKKSGCDRRNNGSRQICDGSRASEIRITEITKQYSEIPSLAAVYPINQSWRAIEDGCVGLERGTIFCELYKPFAGDKCRNGGHGK